MPSVYFSVRILFLNFVFTKNQPFNLKLKTRLAYGKNSCLILSADFLRNPVIYPVIFPFSESMNRIRVTGCGEYILTKPKTISMTNFGHKIMLTVLVLLITPPLGLQPQPLMPAP